MQYVRDLETLCPADRSTDFRSGTIEFLNENEEQRTAQLRVASGCLTKEEWLCLSFQTQHGLSDHATDDLLAILTKENLDDSNLRTVKSRTLLEWAHKANDVEHRIYNFHQPCDGDHELEFWLRDREPIVRQVLQDVDSVYLGFEARSSSR